MRVSLEQGRGGPPLYLQLANALQEFIGQAKLQPGDLLPSENTLASENHLSRSTVIKAFDTLIERGLISRRQGRGTFVNAPPMQRQLPEFTSFSEHVHELGLVPGSELLSFERYEPRSSQRPSSPFDDDESLISIERVRLVDGVPVGIHRALVSGRYRGSHRDGRAGSRRTRFLLLRNPQGQRGPSFVRRGDPESDQRKRV